MQRIDVDAMLDELSAQDLLRWMAFLAVKSERIAEAQRNAAEGYDDDIVSEWGDEE